MKVPYRLLELLLLVGLASVTEMQTVLIDDAERAAEEADRSPVSQEFRRFSFQHTVDSAAKTDLVLTCSNLPAGIRIKTGGQLRVRRGASLVIVRGSTLNVHEGATLIIEKALIMCEGSRVSIRAGQRAVLQENTFLGETMVVSPNGEVETLCPYVERVQRPSRHRRGWKC